MLLLLSDGQLCCAGAEHVSALLPDEAPPLADGALEQAASELPPLKEWTSRADGALCAAASAARAAVGSALPPVGAAAAPAAVAKQAARVAWVDEQMAAHELHGLLDFGGGTGSLRGHVVAPVFKGKHQPHVQQAMQRPACKAQCERQILPALAGIASP